MTKIDIVKRVSEVTGLTLPKAKQAVECLLSAIRESVAGGHRVHFRKFGSFFPRKKTERVGRNPKTGEEVTITARTVPRFKASRLLKEEVNA